MIFKAERVEMVLQLLFLWSYPPLSLVQGFPNLAKDLK